MVRYSRLMTSSSPSPVEHFLGCHVNAFEAFAGRVPAKIMVDNLKSAVLQRSIGQAPFNPRYADFARHHRFEIAPCNVRHTETGTAASRPASAREEELPRRTRRPRLPRANPAARNWLDSVANVRVHGETHKRPLDLFALERDQLRPLPELLYDLGAVHTVRASNRFLAKAENRDYFRGARGPGASVAHRVQDMPARSHLGGPPSTPIAIPCPPSTPLSA